MIAVVAVDCPSEPKSWETCGVAKIACADWQARIPCDCQNGGGSAIRRLVFVHRNKCSAECGDILNRARTCKCVAVVVVASQGAQSDGGETPARVHYSAVWFTVGDLSHLAGRIKTLEASLESAFDEPAIQQAFRRFDDDALGEFVELASPLVLCPGNEVLEARLGARLKDGDWCKAVAARVGGRQELKTILGDADFKTRSAKVLVWVHTPGNLPALARCL